MKNTGFSLLELLITLLLSSLVLSIFLLGLSRFGELESKMIKTIQAQDSAITALILLKHQVESATKTSQCNPNALAPYQVLTANDPLINWDKKPRQVIGQHVLLIRQISNTTKLANTIIPIAFTKDRKASILVDDCEKMTVIKEPELTTALKNFKMPVYLSFIETRFYYLGKTNDPSSPAALSRYLVDRQKIMLNISKIDFIANQGKLEIQVQPQYSTEVYHVKL